MATSYSAYPPPPNHDLEVGTDGGVRYPPYPFTGAGDKRGYLGVNQPPYGKPSNSTGPESDDDQERRRIGTRTPSPTPSEAKELATGAIDWKAISSWKFWFRREWLWYYVALVIILVLTALITLYHKQIVHWLTPVTRWLHDLSFGWLVPIGVLFVISFPPLFGHEIVAILCGLVWGLWVGFAIVSAGTFLGEVGNFYAFKWCCRSRGEKLERTKITYACLAKVVRDGGFKIALIARLSAIPGHFTTAIFSTCGMGIIVFSLAAILSMPKQFIAVYLGVILEQSSTGIQDTKSRIISDVVLAVTFLITVVAMWYIYREMNKIKPSVIYERRKARQAKLTRAWATPGGSSLNSPTPYHNAFASETTLAFNDASPGQSTDSIPLKTAVPGRIHAPRPQAAGGGFPYASYGGDLGYGQGRGGEHRATESTDEVGWDMMNMKPLEHAKTETMGGGYGIGLGRGGGAYKGVRQGSDESSGSSVETLRNPYGVGGPTAGAASQQQPPYSRQHEANMTQTPTQAPFVSWQRSTPTGPMPAQQIPTHASHRISEEGPLPMPSFGPAPASIPGPSVSLVGGGTPGRAGRGHAQDATDASYRTALSSSPEPLDMHNRFKPGQQTPVVQHGQAQRQPSHPNPHRTLSPTGRPPSYQSYAS